MSGKKEITHIDLAGMTTVGKAVGTRAVSRQQKLKVQTSRLKVLLEKNL